MVYTFPKMHYQPMTKAEASQCVKSFAKTVMEAILQLHGHGFVHDDIRLPNICFNERFEAVLIDLDRIVGSNTLMVKKEWQAFGSVLASLKDNRVQAWNDFVKRLQEGHQPDIKVLQHVPDQSTVELVLRQRRR